MKSIVLFGAGNVATHLFKAFSLAKNFEVVQVYNHKEPALDYFRKAVKTTTDLSQIVPADIYLLAVKDEAIPGLAKKLFPTNALIAHTSGGTSIDVFRNFSRAGVFYPLQTFSKTREVDFKNIPVCIEANNEADLKLLEEMAGEISGNIFNVSSEQRRSLHVAAVFVSNFVNYLYTEGEEICRQNNLPFDILQPLILETAEKITRLNPKEAQTGPAIRRDQSVIESHLQLLNPEQQKIYQVLTQSIQNLHGKKL